LVDNVIIMPISIDNVNHRDDDVLELVHGLMHQVRAQVHQELRGELTPMEARVLRFFGRRPGATQSELAQHSGRDKAQLARLIKGLRDRGLLATAESEDRRQVCLVLSPAGEALQRRLRQLDRRMSARAVAGFSERDQAQLHSLLQRVRENLRG
jgi:DNA-binding MarR family transcriptional regulator